MKNIYGVALSLILLLGVGQATGIAASEKYGQAISNLKVTAIKEILAHPKEYEGKLVTIEGKIASECPTGCWFYVKVKKGDVTIYVDIGNSGFAIPQHTGKTVLVEGKVVLQKAGPMIQGRGVEVK